MKNERVFYYSDPLNDDFAGTDIKTCRLPSDYKYVHNSLFWRVISFIVYYLIAIPVVWLTAKILLGLKFENRRVLRKLRGQGFFLYGNHTQMLDAYIPPLAAFPKRSYVLANPDAVSIPGIKNLVMMLGALPLPSESAGFCGLIDAIERRCSEGACISVYPEAHIWPYYTGVRPFGDASFCYPVKTGAPAVAMVTTYRKRRGLFALCRRPGMTVTFSDVILPDPSLPPRQARAKMRDEAFAFMDGVSRSTEQPAYIRYVRKSDES